MENSQTKTWKKILITSIGTGSSQIINFIFGLLLVRILSVDEYAVYKQGNLILNIAMSFFFIISPISLSYFLAKAENKMEKKQYVVQTILSLILVSGIGAILIYCFRDFISQTYTNILLEKYMIYFAIIIFLETTSSYYTYYMVAENKNKKLAYDTVFFSILRVIALLLSLNFKDNTFEIFLICYVGNLIIKSIYILYQTYKLFKNVKYKFSIALFKSQIIFSIPVMLMGIITAINNNIDKNLVSTIYEPNAYAIYVNGAFEVPFISIISTSIITVMLPEIAKKLNKQSKKELDEVIIKFKKIIVASTAIIIPIIFAILTFSREVVVILFSEQYIDCLNLFRIYLFMIFFKSLNLSVLITAINHQKALVKSGIVMILSNIVFIYIINERLGFDYITLAPVLATLVMNILMIKDIKNIYKQDSIFNILPSVPILKFMLIGIIECIIIYNGKNLLPGNEIIKAIILGPVTYLIMLATCIISDKNLKKELMKIKEKFLNKKEEKNGTI